MLLTETIMWLSVGLIGYAYVGYPLILILLARYRVRKVKKADIRPQVSLIIAAYNEESRIAEKLDNVLKVAYPTEKIEIIVASDCSSDNTDKIVRSYAGRGIRLITASSRKGKEAAQKLAVEAAVGEILIFSDVSTIMPENAVANIVKNFADPSVGCVSSVDVFLDRDGRISGEGAYVKYEMFLRSLETQVHSLVGLSGSFFAARSTVCKQDWAEDLQSDFNTVLNSMRMGLRGIADPQTVGYYKDLADGQKEFDRKVRTVLRGISVFMRSLPLVNPFRYPIFAWQLGSHKLCRWLVPFAMLGAMVSNAILAVSSPWYRWVLLLQALFYAVAVGGIFCKPFHRVALLKLPAFFVVVNASILKAWMKYWCGERVVSWEPSKR